jgi:hypothetical protein
VAVSQPGHNLHRAKATLHSSGRPQKQYWDLTGNGVNHPNDFCHRIYAQVLSALLVKQPTTR